MELFPDIWVQYLRDDVRDNGECCNDTAQGIVGLCPRCCKTISKYVDIDDSDINNEDRVNEESDEDSSDGAEYNNTTQGIGDLHPPRRCKTISKYVEIDDSDIDNSSCGNEDSVNDEIDEESSKCQCE
jgi:septum formation topological specificity factor MinE